MFIIIINIKTCFEDLLLIAIVVVVKSVDVGDFVEFGSPRLDLIELGVEIGRIDRRVVRTRVTVTTGRDWSTATIAAACSIISVVRERAQSILVGLGTTGRWTHRTRIDAHVQRAQRRAVHAALALVRVLLQAIVGRLYRVVVDLAQFAVYEVAHVCVLRPVCFHPTYLGHWRNVLKTQN